MKRILLVGLVLGYTMFSFAQTCTPDLTITNTGIFPDQLPNADVNMTYNEVIQIKAPLDTTVFVPQLGADVQVEVDSMQINDIIGLPAGMTFGCHNAECMIMGGAVGCVVISGTSTESGFYPLRIISTTNAQAILGSTRVPQTQVDTIDSYSLFVNWPTGLAKIVDSKKLTVYPNPAKDMVTIEGDFTNPISQAVLYDILGNRIQTFLFSGNNYSETFALKNVKSGLYFITLTNGKTHYSQRLLID